MQREIQCFAHIRRLAPDKIDTLSLGALQTDIKQAWDLCRIQMPFAISVKLARKFTESLISAEKWMDVARSLRPWRLPVVKSQPPPPMSGM